MSRDEAYYRAMLARDPRFDGKFFVGVKTTGVYCRPVCPARPRRENVEFFASALLAERRGYRPCLRCRPEAAPRSPAWEGRSALVRRALRAISDQEHRGLDEDAFAARFGVGARHLRRLFADEIGKTPKRLMIESRLDFSRKLLAETSLPVGEVAFAAGFASLRRFNDAFRDRFRRAPTRLRKAGAASGREARGPGLVLSLPYRPPLDFAAALAHCRSHAIAGLETFRDGAYERVFRFDDPEAGARGKGALGLVRISAPEEASGPRGRRPGARAGGGPACLRLEVVGGETRSLGRVVRAARRLFDLDSDPVLVSNAFAACPRLAALRRRHPGLRCPRGWDPYETAVGAILGQFVSVAAANRLVAQLLAGHGEPAAHPVTGEELRLFPGPGALAEADLAGVGTTRARKESLREFARRLLDGRLSLDSAQDPEAFRRAFLAIKGIGPWTAKYVGLRAIADTDAFPAADLVLKRALADDPALDLDAVKPWRGYAAAHLWHAHARARLEESP